MTYQVYPILSSSEPTYQCGPLRMTLVEETMLWGIWDTNHPERPFAEFHYTTESFADAVAWAISHAEEYDVERGPPPRAGHHFHDRAKRNEELAFEEEMRGERRLIADVTLNGYRYTAWALNQHNEMGSMFEILIDSGFINYCRRCQDDRDVLAALERLLESNRRNARVQAQV